MVLEEFIVDFLKNRKKYMRCVVAFICAFLIVKYGILRALFIIFVSLIGYVSGSPEFYTKIKKIYSDIVQK